MKNKEIVVIGGSNIDYLGEIDNLVKMNESNPGKVEMCFGGVARNITENLVRLGVKVHFFTAVGEDELGQLLTKQLLSLGTKLYIPQGITKTGSFLAINHQHNLLLGICDADYIDQLDCNFLQQHNTLIKNSPYIVIDSNITEEALAYLFKTYSDHKIIADGISSKKVLKLKPYLDKIYLLKVNYYEGLALTNKKEKQEMIQDLRLKGVKNVVLTSGQEPTLYNINEQIVAEPIIKVAKVVNTNGAGDALLAGVIYEILQNKTISEGVKFGLQLASFNIQSKKSVEINSIM